MTKGEKNLPQPTKRAKPLGAKERRFVLRSVAEYRSTAWIVATLKEKYDITLSPITVDVGYRWNKVYYKQIEKYRKEYNNKLEDEAFGSKRFVLQALKTAYDMAEQQKDPKAMVQVIAQASKMMGFDAPAEIEINHGTGGSGSFEDMLRGLLDTKPVIDVTPDAPKALPGVAVEIPVPPIPEQALVELESAPSNGATDTQ